MRPVDLLARPSRAWTFWVDLLLPTEPAWYRTRLCLPLQTIINTYHFPSFGQVCDLQANMRAICQWLRESIVDKIITAREAGRLVGSMSFAKYSASLPCQSASYSHVVGFWPQAVHTARAQGVGIVNVDL